MTTARLEETQMAGNAVAAIAAIRDSVCAVFGMRRDRDTGLFRGGILGTAWCVAADAYYVTAHHVLNGGEPTEPNDKFYLLRAPNNGSALQWWPVTGIHLEDAAHDLAILAAPTPATYKFSVSAVPVTTTAPPDGAPLLSYGVPAGIVERFFADPAGVLTDIQTLLFTHGKTGIVAAQYDHGSGRAFEFSVATHVGESGGPIVRLDEPYAAFSVTQNYRILRTDHGAVDGPRRGYALATIQSALQQIGATFVG